MDENQQDIFEEEEEVDSAASHSDLFSLLNDIKQPLIIDEEAASQTELSPDAYALSEVIKQLLPLLNGSCSLYSDLRQRFVEQKLKQNHFAFQSEVIADFEPNASEANLRNNDKLKISLARMAAHLRQLNAETKAAEIQRSELTNQLRRENDDLRRELSIIRQAEYVGSSASSPERASSSQVTFITPRTIRTDRLSGSSSPSEPSGLLQIPNNSSSLSPKQNNLSSLSPKQNNSSSFSSRQNNSSSLSPKPKNSSSLSPKPKNSSSLSARPNNSSSLSPKYNNSPSLSPKPNDSSSSPKPNNVSTISQRPKNSSSFSARSNQSSSTSPK